MEAAVKINNRIHPQFPKMFEGIQPVFPVWGGNRVGVTLGSLQCLASIPLYTMCEDSDPDKERLKKAYYEEKQKEYERIKEVYEKNCFVGTVFGGGGKNTARITKIVITEEKAYICYRASFQHIKDVEEENKTRSMQMKSIKPGVFGLNTFLSGIANGYIKIVSIPQ
jgi:hypothetical protein